MASTSFEGKWGIQAQPANTPTVETTALVQLAVTVGVLLLVRPSWVMTRPSSIQAPRVSCARAACIAAAVTAATYAYPGLHG